MQFTPKKTIGGRAWIFIQLQSVQQEKALALLGNTSLGFLLHWYHANKQQSGRGSVGVLPLKTLPVLDVTALKPKQLAEAEKLFSAIANKNLLPAHQLDEDATRRELDEKSGKDVLGLPDHLFKSGGSVELLRQKLAMEPSVRGNKAEEESAKSEQLTQAAR